MEVAERSSKAFMCLPRLCLASLKVTLALTCLEATPKPGAIRQNLQSDLKRISGGFWVWGVFWAFWFSRFLEFVLAFLAVLGLWAI